MNARKTGGRTGDRWGTGGTRAGTEGGGGLDLSERAENPLTQKVAEATAACSGGENKRRKL